MMYSELEDELKKIDAELQRLAVERTKRQNEIDAAGTKAQINKEALDMSVSVYKALKREDVVDIQKVAKLKKAIKMLHTFYNQSRIYHKVLQGGTIIFDSKLLLLQNARDQLRDNLTKITQNILFFSL